jgi:hypothetical protein
MSTPFAITTATNSVFLDDNRQVRAHITVSNTSGRTLRGRAIVKAENPTVEKWLDIEGDVARSFAVAGTEQYTIRVDVPDDAPAGNYSFHLDMVGEERPDEQYAEGPTLTFEVPEPAEAADQGFPRTLVLAIAALLVIGGGFLIYQLLPTGTTGNNGLSGPDTVQGEAQTAEAAEPHIWARGTTCLTFGESFDLDQGSFRNGDLFYRNMGGGERYLQPTGPGVPSGIRMAPGGKTPLEKISYSDLEAADYGEERLDASYREGGEVRSGTTWFILTSEGRYAKIHILQTGQYMQFEWVTFAKEGEMGSLAASPFQNGTCSKEEAINCESGALSGDEIRDVRILEKESEEALLEIDLSFNRDHGTVYVVPNLLDNQGEVLSGRYQINTAEQGINHVPVFYTLSGRAQSTEVLIYLFEAGEPSNAFLCRRFPLEDQWGSL